jgi:hypothetical protein
MKKMKKMPHVHRHNMGMMDIGAGRKINTKKSNIKTPLMSPKARHNWEMSGVGKHCVHP